LILADTSVWVDHFRTGDPRLPKHLESQQVLIHPMVIGELACGDMPNRASVLDVLQKLPRARSASDEEALFFIERYSLMGKGIGFIDVHLLASVAITDGAHLWTLDRRLQAIANDVDIAYRDK
jgi:hypothetical protein